MKLETRLAFELSQAYLWLEKLKPFLGGNQYEKARAVIMHFESKGFPHRNWKKLLLESFAKDDAFRICRRIMRFANLNDARALLDELILNDVYGLDALTDINRVVDAGAANGLFSRLVINKFPEAHVYTIEPNPINLKMIKKNLSTEIKRGKVTLYEGALSTTNGTVYIEIPQDVRVWGGLGATSVRRERIKIRESRKIKVKSIKISDLLIRQIDLLKCDIEGAEFDVLCSAGDKIRQCKRVLVEIHSDTLDFAHNYSRLVTFFTAQNFDITCYEGVKSCADIFRGKPFPSFMLCAVNKCEVKKFDDSKY